MTVKLENIDEVSRRANVSYKDAKTALEMRSDDLVGADNLNNL